MTNLYYIPVLRYYIMAITIGVLGSAPFSNAERVAFGSFTDLVENASLSVQFPGETVSYNLNSVNFTNMLTGLAITNNVRFCLIYSMGVDFGGGYVGYVPVGGMDGVGVTASGYFNKDDANWWGMTNGRTANYIEGNVDLGYWSAFVDANGNGTFGTYDFDNPYFDWEPGEYIDSFRLNNFQPFQTNAGTLSAGDVSGQYNLPSSLSILTMTLLQHNGTNNITITVDGTKHNPDVGTITLHYCDSLTNGNWRYLATSGFPWWEYEIRTMTDSSTSPQRFYRAQSP